MFSLADILDMSKIDLVRKKLLANCFRNFSKGNDSQKSFVKQSLINIGTIARITNLTKL